MGTGIDTATAGVPGAQAIFDVIGGILRLLPGDENTFSEFAWFGNIINIIIGILTIATAIKIFFRLMGKYLTLIIYPAFSPFIFATAALPGNGTKSIVFYIKVLGSASLFYIVTYAMFLLTLIFTDPTFQGSLPDFRTNGYIPPLLGIQQIVTELSSQADSFPLTQLLLTLVGIGIYFSIPKTLDGIDDALGTKLVIPQFIKTPFEAMSENLNTTFKAAQWATRPVPGAVRFARNELNPGRLSTRFNALRDLRKGLKPGEQGTYQNVESRKLAERKAAAQRARQTAIQNGNNAGVRAANREIDSIDREASRRGIPVGYAEDAKKPELKATFKWSNGISADNMISLNTAGIDALYTTLSSKPEAFIYAGKMVFEASNFTFPDKPDIQIGTAVQISGSEYDFGIPATPAADFRSPGTKPFGDPSGDPKLKLPEMVQLIVGGDSPTDPTTPQNVRPDTDGKKIEVNMWLRFDISAFRTLFGTKAGDSYTGGHVDTNTPLQFQRRVFKLAQYESNAVKVVMTYTGS